MKRLKQKNRKVEDVLVNVIERVKEKYSEYQDVLNEEFYNKLEIELLILYKPDASINQQVELLLIASNLVLKRLVDEINLNNIDIEISLIEKYKNIVNLVMRKMGFSEDVIDENRENILIDALKDYDGNRLFSLCIVDYIRKNINNSIDENISLDNYLDEYTKNKQCLKIPTYIEKISKKLDILSVVDDKNLSKFIYLKYGYYNDIYFSNEEISSITSMKIEDVNNYYKKSLILLKSVVNKYIDNLVKEEDNDILISKFKTK